MNTCFLLLSWVFVSNILVLNINRGESIGNQQNPQVNIKSRSEVKIRKWNMNFCKPCLYLELVQQSRQVVSLVNDINMIYVFVKIETR